MRPKILNTLKLFIGWPLSIAAFIFIGRVLFTHGSIVRAEITNINPYIFLLGICCFLGYFIIRSYVFNEIINENIPFIKAAFSWEISELKRYVPGNIWPLVGRVELFADIGIPRRKTAKALITEAQLFLISGVIFSLVSLPFVIDNFLPQLGNQAIPYISYLSVAALTILTIYGRRLFKFKNSFLAKLVRIIFPEIKESTCAKLLITYIFSQIFFGLGTYFSIASFTYLDPYFLPTYVSFFVLSLILGYLVLLAPMGLGVREGIIVVGLSRFTPATLASIGALLARITLVISEIIFLAALYLLYKVKNSVLERTINYIGKNIQEVILGLSTACYIIYFASISIIKHNNFYTGRFDLGNMDQTVWNTIHGRIFQTGSDTEIISRLSSHADFLLILISPLYLVWEDPRMLLLLQTVVVALGAIFIFKIAQLILKSKTAANVFSALFLLNPALQFANLYDFHAVTLATTLLLGAFYFFMKKRWLWFLIFAILAGLTKEQVWVVVALFGVYSIFAELVFSPRKSFVNLVRGAAIASVSLAIFYYLVSYVIPNIRGDEHFALSYYSEFGNNPSSVIKNVILSPGDVLQKLLNETRLDYLRQIFQPLGFLSLLSPIVLIFTLPDLAINLLSANSNMYQIYYQYTAVITPFIFIAAIFGVKNLTKWFPRLPLSFLLVFLSLTTIYSAYQYGPLPGAKNPNIEMIANKNENRKEISSFLKTIPKEAKVAATNNVGAHLSQREYIFTIPIGIEEADYVVFLLGDDSSKSSLEEREIAESLKNNPDYELLLELEDFIAFKKVSIYATF